MYRYNFCMFQHRKYTFQQYWIGNVFNRFNNKKAHIFIRLVGTLSKANDYLEKEEISLIILCISLVIVVILIDILIDRIPLRMWQYARCASMNKSFSQNNSRTFEYFNSVCLFNICGGEFQSAGTEERLHVELVNDTNIITRLVKNCFFLLFEF